eukprot:30229-Chlamydomonas_euryale.AAC.2
MLRQHKVDMLRQHTAHTLRQHKVDMLRQHTAHKTQQHTAHMLRLQRCGGSCRSILHGSQRSMQMYTCAMRTYASSECIRALHKFTRHPNLELEF